MTCRELHNILYICIYSVFMDTYLEAVSVPKTRYFMWLFNCDRYIQLMSEHKMSRTPKGW